MSGLGFIHQFFVRWDESVIIKYIRRTGLHKYIRSTWLQRATIFTKYHQ